jgi:hypothetical protein
MLENTFDYQNRDFPLFFYIFFVGKAHPFIVLLVKNLWQVWCGNYYFSSINFIFGKFTLYRWPSLPFV